MVRVIFFPHAVEGKQNIVGIKITARSEALSGMELDALAQLKGVLQAISRCCPRFCQGTTLVEPASNCTKRFKMVCEEASNVVPAEYNEGLKPSGLPSEQNTKVLACAAPVTAMPSPRLSASSVFFIILS